MNTEDVCGQKQLVCGLLEITKTSYFNWSFLLVLELYKHIMLDSPCKTQILEENQLEKTASQFVRITSFSSKIEKNHKAIKYGESQTLWDELNIIAEA